MSCEGCREKADPTADSLGNLVALTREAGHSAGFLEGVEWATKSMKVALLASLPRWATKGMRARAELNVDRAVAYVGGKAREWAPTGEAQKKAADAMLRRVSSNIRPRPPSLRSRLRSALAVLRG